MSIKYRIYKQLIPAPLNENDPFWARRQIWVAKLSAEDVIDEFDSLQEAEDFKELLQSSDPSGRIYQVRQIET